VTPKEKERHFFTSTSYTPVKNPTVAGAGKKKSMKPSTNQTIESTEVY